MARVGNAARREKEEKEEELQANLRQADFNMIIKKLEDDLTILTEHVGDEMQQAQNCALDIKYIRDRQKQLVFNYLKCVNKCGESASGHQ